MTKTSGWLALALLILGTAAARAEEKHPLAGTWTGKLESKDESLPVTLKFSDAGRPIYEYVTKTGKRSVELKKKGDTIKFVPAEGGMITGTVQEVSVTKAGFRYVLQMESFHQGRYVTTRKWVTLTLEGKLSDGELTTQMKVAMKARINNQPYTTSDERGVKTKTAVVDVPEETATVKGTLKRE